MKASYDKALEVIARGCGIEPALVQAIVQVESSGNPRAVRYEPAFYERYVKGSSYPQAEHRLLASSLGLLQVMGLVAREYGFCGPLVLQRKVGPFNPYIADLHSPDRQI